MMTNKTLLYSMYVFLNVLFLFGYLFLHKFFAHNKSTVSQIWFNIFFHFGVSMDFILFFCDEITIIDKFSSMQIRFFVQIFIVCSLSLYLFFEHSFLLHICFILWLQVDPSDLYLYYLWQKSVCTICSLQCTQSFIQFKGCKA